MPRRKKSGLDYWLENCFRCANMIRCHYLVNGVDDGSVTFKCKLTGDFVLPWTIDGCKRFEFGLPEEVIIDRNKERINDIDGGSK